MKLAIGTAQFGLDYGVSNSLGKVSQDGIGRILATATSKGVKTIDTASAYGKSEEALGKAGVASFDVVTKFGEVPKKTIDVKKWVNEQIEASLLKLNINSIYGLLLHRPDELLGSNGDIIYKALSEAKSDGLIKNIGISISDPIELNKIIDRFDIHIVQAPMNIFDRRLHSSGWLGRLNNLGVEVHIRSVFLQGLLLMSPELRPDYFRQWDRLFQNYDHWLCNSKILAIDACLGFINQFSAIDRIIIGIASPSNLDEILKALNRQASKLIPSNIQSDDKNLINPAEWPV
ncbi:aldo/keto reductase [Gammaproteobacteria bacterium]|nr:aldo/keto reductase [Gammaproteobacteria bacterium]